MEKISHLHIDRGINAEEEPEAFKNTVKGLDKMGAEKFEGELEKTQRDLELINFAQSNLGEYLKHYGRERIIDILPDKVHIVPQDGVKKLTSGRHTDGVAAPMYGSMVVDRNLNDIDFTKILFHEMYHLKVHQTIRVNHEDFVELHRSGFTVISRDNQKVYFRLLEEVINDFLCKKFFNEKIKKSELFDKELKDNTDFLTHRKEALNKFSNTIEIMYEKNKNDFKDQEEIVKLFFNASMNGRLLPVARLIEKTYGTGSFRKLAEETKY